jgi:hypothetical protein
MGSGCEGLYYRVKTGDKVNIYTIVSQAYNEYFFVRRVLPVEFDGEKGEQKLTIVKITDLAHKEFFYTYLAAIDGIKSELLAN